MHNYYTTVPAERKAQAAQAIAGVFALTNTAINPQSNILLLEKIINRESDAVEVPLPERERLLLLGLLMQDAKNPETLRTLLYRKDHDLLTYAKEWARMTDSFHLTFEADMFLVDNFLCQMQVIQGRPKVITQEPSAPVPFIQLIDIALKKHPSIAREESTIDVERISRNRFRLIKPIWRLGDSLQAEASALIQPSDIA